MDLQDQANADVDTDRSEQERRWQLSRIGWGIMLALLVAATIGLTGSGGPIARTHVQVGAARIDLPRISRWAAADYFTIEFGHDSQAGAAVTVPAAFIDIFTIEAVSPQPRSVVATPTGHRFEFDFADGIGQRSARFSIRAGSPSLPTRIGRFKVDDAEASDISVTVLP